MNDTVDFGEITLCQIMSSVQVAGLNVANFMSTWEKLSDVDTLSGVPTTGWGGVAEFRASNDDITWTGWKPLNYRKVGARYFQFRLKLFSNNPLVTPSVSSWKVEIDLEERYLGDNTKLNELCLFIQEVKSKHPKNNPQ